MKPPLFDDADQMATDGYHKKIQERLTAVTANPAHTTEFTVAWQEIGNAWLPLWGLRPHWNGLARARVALEREQMIKRWLR